MILGEATFTTLTIRSGSGLTYFLPGSKSFSAILRGPAIFMGNKQTIHMLSHAGRSPGSAGCLHHVAFPDLQLAQGRVSKEKETLCHHAVVYRMTEGKTDYFCGVNPPAKGWWFYIDFSSGC